MWNRKLLSRVVDIGWLLDNDRAGFIWDAPRKLRRDEVKNKNAKALSYCPAVIDYESRFFEISCPIDINLRFEIHKETQRPVLINTAGNQSTIRPKHLNQMLSIVDRNEWRNPDRPIIQIITPYLFIADDDVYMSQLPAFCHYRDSPMPGLMIGGAFPINIWPRPLMWAFEWYDIKKELVIKRGEPWFYVRFETSNPSRTVRLIEAEMTPALKDYITGASGVTNYISRTFSLFNVARQRRPKTLLVSKKR